MRRLTVGRGILPIRTSGRISMPYAVRFVPLQRVPDMTEQSNKPGPINAQPTANEDASATPDAISAQTPPESRQVPQEARTPTHKRKLLAGVVGVAVLAALLVFGASAALAAPNKQLTVAYWQKVFGSSFQA